MLDLHHNCAELKQIPSGGALGTADHKIGSDRYTTNCRVRFRYDPGA